MNVRNIPPIRKLLVPTDFSPESVNALYYAVALAEKLGCRVLVYHAVHFPLVDPHGIASVQTPEELEGKSEKRLAALLDEVVAATGFHQITSNSGAGFALDGIVGFARDEEVDLVVMGTRGAEGLSGMLLGSNTAEVMEKCGCPVLAIPVGVAFHSPKRILFATDYSDNDFQSIYLLSQYFRTFQTEIVVAHVEHNGNLKVEQKLMEWFKDQVLKNIPYDRITFELLEGRHVGSTLEEHIERTGYDIVVTSMRRRNFFDRLTSRSLTKQLAHHPVVPLLVFHAYTASGTPVF